MKLVVAIGLLQRQQLSPLVSHHWRRLHSRVFFELKIIFVDFYSTFFQYSNHLCVHSACNYLHLHDKSLLEVEKRNM